MWHDRTAPCNESLVLFLFFYFNFFFEARYRCLCLLTRASASVATERGSVLCNMRLFLLNFYFRIYERTENP